MIRTVPIDQIEQKHLTALARSVLAAPPEERDSPRELLLNIKAGISHLFEVDAGIVLCRKCDRVMMLDALCCPDAMLGIAETARAYEGLAEDLKKLAAEWGCDKIKTTVYDPRLASVIQHLGGSIESRIMVLAVEHGDG